jgi:hypothetical protein
LVIDGGLVVHPLVDDYSTCPFSRGFFVTLAPESVRTEKRGFHLYPKEKRKMQHADKLKKKENFIFF